MTTETPAFYDATNAVIRPMDAGATIPNTAIPVSAALGNVIQNLSDGLYVGSYQGTALYVNSSTGSDSNAGTEGSPFLTINGALTHLQSLFLSNQFVGQATIALACGHSYPWTADFNLYGGSIDFTFYGDPTYGDYNSALVNGTTHGWFMSNLERPIITPTTYTGTSGQYQMYGINILGGSVSLNGVQINLPAAPVSPGITNYGGYCDFIRSAIGATQVGVYTSGTVVNMTDVTAFWGFLGCFSRSFVNLGQLATQFQINGIVMSAANSPSSTQLQQRQYFIKFIQDYATNNQNVLWLSTTATNSSTGSGMIQCSWSDGESLTVTGSEVTLATFPISFQPSYGLINYILNLTTNSSGLPLNFLNTRLS